MGNQRRIAKVVPYTMTKLIYVDDSLPGYTRRRAGKGWAYYDQQHGLITSEAERKRLNAIALPPAYTDAWYYPAPNGHILATGIDAKRRKQYRYHPEYRAMREREKFGGCLTFGRLLPHVRRRVEEELRSGELTREAAIASVVRLLDMGAVRVGNEGYAERNHHYGATTLRQRHAELTGKTLTLHFRGKSGKMRHVELSDDSLARMVRTMQDLPGQHLFHYADEDGDIHPVGSDDVNAFLERALGQHFTAKNFRTWHASVFAFEVLRKGHGHVTIKAVADYVSDRLGNTPAVARNSYIHPAVIDLVDRQEKWRAGLHMPKATRWLTADERGLIAFLAGDVREGEYSEVIWRLP